MKINRAIFCLNDNPLYVGFWNAFSRVWKLKYDIQPTLIYVGDSEEIQYNELSDEYGDIVCLPVIDEVVVDRNMDWSVTWGLFYGASLFKDDVCITSGIDQLPLSDRFFKFLEHSEISDDAYVVGLAGAYLDLPDIYPSSYHIARGDVYKQIFDIDDDWSTEVKKVFSRRLEYPRLPENFWALDEAYSSDVINNSNDNILFMNMFHDYFRPRRLDRGGNLNYNKVSLQAGEYSELHSVRPYEEYKEYIDKLIFDLMEN